MAIDDIIFDPSPPIGDASAFSPAGHPFAITLDGPNIIAIFSGSVLPPEFISVF